MELDTDISAHENNVAAVLKSLDLVEKKLEIVEDGIESIIWASLRSFYGKHNHTFDGLKVEKFEESDASYQLKGTAYWLEFGPTNCQIDFSKTKPQSMYSIKLYDKEGKQTLYIARTQHGWVSSPKINNI